jgi:hypothetical protein
MYSKAFTLGVGYTQSRVQWLPEVKRLGREADHPTTSSSEAKNAPIYSYTSVPRHAFIAWCVMNHGNDFARSEVFLICRKQIIGTI